MRLNRPSLAPLLLWFLSFRFFRGMFNDELGWETGAELPTAELGGVTHVASGVFGTFRTTAKNRRRCQLYCTYKILNLLRCSYLRTSPTWFAESACSQMKLELLVRQIQKMELEKETLRLL